MIYHALGINMISPMINTYIKPEDFLKICKNPREYLSVDIKFDHWTYSMFGRRPLGKIKDVEVLFAHSIDVEQSVRFWNKTRKWINWENLIYVLEDVHEVIPYPVVKEFCQLTTKHLCIMGRSMYMNERLKGAIFVGQEYRVHLHIRDSAIENWFDLLGWMNGTFEL